MILKTEGLTKRFGGLTAVNNVSLKVNEGEIFAIIGPNGAGKTTFLNCITGTLKADGRICYLFRRTPICKDRTPEKMCRMGMSRTFQISRPFPSLSVLENVQIGAVFGAIRHSSKESRGSGRKRLWNLSISRFLRRPLPDG